MSVSNSSLVPPMNKTAEEVNYEIEEAESFDIDHPSFKVKYRSNSIISTGAISDAGTPPTIKVIGTGGTIASKSSSSLQTVGYEVDLTAEELCNSIPDLSSVCTLEYEQLFNKDSKDFGISNLLTLHEKVKEDLKKYDGIVITHGTDTMEETAFFLESTIETNKPIVMCGSMRPSSSISSDGPMNLYQAIVIAASKASRGRGVLVALNDRIGSGFYITKSNANSLDTFKSVGQGYLGNFVSGEIHFYYPPAKPLGVHHFDLKLPLEVDLPEVPIIFAHQGLNNKLIELAISELGAKGLVLATMGAGSMHVDSNKVIADICSRFGNKFPIIYSKRSMDGMVPKGSLPKTVGAEKLPFDCAIASGYLNPQKCRILLQLCLNDGLNISQIKRIFEGVYGG